MPSLRQYANLLRALPMHRPREIGTQERQPDPTAPARAAKRKLRARRRRKLARRGGRR